MNSPRFASRWLRAGLVGLLCGLLTAAAGAQPDLTATARPDEGGLACARLPQLFQIYLQVHYATHDLSEQVRNRTVDELLDSIDPGKNLLMESDLPLVRGQIMSVFESSGAGTCGGLDQAYGLVVQRVAEDEKNVREIMEAKDFKLDAGLELIVDADVRPRPKTRTERKELLRKLVHFQFANLELTDVKPDEAKKELVHRYERLTRRVKERQEKGELTVHFVKAFAEALDPHTSFLSREDLEDFQISMRLSLEGIGVLLGVDDGFPVIQEVVPGGSADRLGIFKPKDRITAVTQDGGKPVSVIDMDLRSVVKMIRGKKGTKVVLSILRRGAKAETFNATIVRDKVAVKDSAASIVYETRDVGGKPAKIAVIELPAFYGGSSGDGPTSSGDVRKLLEEAKKNNVKGVVLNLSRNGGGLLEEAVRVGGLFIKRGAVVATESSSGRREVLEDKNDEVVWNGPLIVLTSHVSASASEILAGALKDYKRAIIAGADHTFGKGTVQVLSQLPQGIGAIKVTMGMFFLPGGASTQQNGVKADIHVPSVFNSDEIGEFKMKGSLAPRRTEVFLSSDTNSTDVGAKWNPVDPALIKRLSDASVARVAKDPAFTKVLKDLEEAKKKDAVKLSEMMKKAKKDENKDRTVKERIKDLEAPFLKEGVSIMADWLSQGGS